MANNLKKYEYAVPVGSLDSYIHWANQIPMLTEEEEHELALQYSRDGDITAAKRLVMAHLRFVISVARNYTGYGLAHADLIQEGSVGLMKAVKRFDPTVGVRLVSFAVHWIKAEMHEYILKNWRIVKVATTKAQRKLFFNLRKSTQHIKTKWLPQSEAQKLAANLNVTEQDVYHMESRMYSPDQSFDTPQNAEDEWASPANTIEDFRYDPAHYAEKVDWADKRSQNLQHTLQGLDARSQNIITQRWLVDDDDKATLHELAAIYHISAERVRQIESNALKKIKSLLSQ